ncbi:MAG: riboflavin synthase [Planctomycetes bacterium]|nr:riboflavin synthase [Planctomycetota bacterium]
MFTGLVRCLGTVGSVTRFGAGRRFSIDAGPLAAQVAVGQSVAVNGVCLTVTALHGPAASFDAVAETVARSNLCRLRAGDTVNLEPALKAGDALDGHIVLGHVDALGTVLKIETAESDNRRVHIALPPAIRRLVAEKGSIAIDGISLTVADVGADRFSVAVIPHTWTTTTLSRRVVGDAVNLEADVLARYAARILDTETPTDGITMDTLRANGFL